MDENKITDFDAANAATQSIIENQPTEHETAALEDERQASENIAQADAEQEALATAEQASNVAEAGAQAAQQRSDELQNALNQISQIQQQNAQLMQQNSQLQELMKQMNDTGREQVIQENMPQVPELNFSQLAFMDEEDQHIAQQKYTSDVANYVRQTTMKELAPFIEQAKKGQMESEKSEIMSALANVPELGGISDMSSQLDRIIANNKIFQSDNIPLDEKYIAAYAIAKGVEAMNNPPKQPTIDELVQLYNTNSEFKDAVEKQRLSEVKNNTQSVPPILSGSAGNGNIAVDIPDKPKNWGDAFELTKKQYFPGL